MAPEQRTQETPAAELLLEHPVQENALRVTWLMPGASGDASAEQELLDSAAVRHRPREPQASAQDCSKTIALSGAIIFPDSGRAPLAPGGLGVHHNGG